MDSLLTPNKAAEILAIPVKTLHELCRRRLLGYVRINGKGERRFTTAHLQAYIELQTILPAEPVDKTAGCPVRSTLKPTPRKGGDDAGSVGVKGSGLLREEIRQLCR